MRNVRVKVSGLPELKRAFGGLEDQVRALAPAAAKEAGNHIADRWRERAPVGAGDEHPGKKYKDAIDVRARRNKNGARAIVAARTYRPYPYFLEKGTSKTSAHPSAIPAYDAGRDQAIASAGDKLAEVRG